MDQLDYHRRCILCVKHFTYPKATCANTPVKPDQSTAICANTPVKPTATCANTPDQSTAACANTPVKPDQCTAKCANTPVKPDQSTATCANTPVKPDQSTPTCANTPVKLHSHIVVCSAATDGQLVLWDITMTIEAWLDSTLGSGIKDERVCPVVPLCVIPCHQSGINDMDIKCTAGNCKN